MYKIFKIYKLNKKGFSLLELAVSVGIFAFLIVMSTGIFQSIVKGQQASIAVQDTQENMRYAFEVMSKEIRNAKKGTQSAVNPNSHLCLLDNTDLDNRVFSTSSVAFWGATSDIFYFKNKYEHCVYYYLVNETLMKRYDDNLGAADSVYVASTTPVSISVTDFKVSIRDNAYNETFSNWIQPSVTMAIIAKAKGHENLRNETKMQTTISSRMYE